MNTRIFLLCLSLFAAWGPHFSWAQEPKEQELTKEEQTKIRELLRAAQNDEEVKRTRQESKQAIRRHQEALRTAILKRDPSAEPLLGKMRDSVANDVEWRSQTEDTLRTLNLPLRRLNMDERRRWLDTAQKLQDRDFVKAFRMKARQEREQRAGQKRTHAKTVREFRGKMRQAMLEANPDLKDILDKLEAPERVTPAQKGS